MNKNVISSTSYVTGFIGSLALTLAAFYLTIIHLNSDHVWPPHSIIILIVFGLAFIQFITQVIFFLHLFREKKPRLNLFAFIFTILGLVIVIGGTIWISNNLDNRM